MKLNTKNKTLITGFILALFLCYIFAFSNTITYYKIYNAQVESNSGNANLPETLKRLTKKEKELDNMIKQYDLNTTNTMFQNVLLKELTRLSNKYNIRITDFKEPHNFFTDGIAQHSYIFSLEGSFNEILLLINSIENNITLGYIKQLKFEKNKNYKTNKDYLVAEVILQRKELLN